MKSKTMSITPVRCPQVHIASRSGAWVIPNYFFGCPVDTLIARLSNQMPPSLFNLMLKLLVITSQGHPNKWVIVSYLKSHGKYFNTMHMTHLLLTVILGISNAWNDILLFNIILLLSIIVLTLKIKIGWRLGFFKPEKIVLYWKQVYSLKALKLV